MTITKKCNLDIHFRTHVTCCSYFIRHIVKKIQPLMRVFIFLLLVLGCKTKENDSLLGKWQILRLQGKDSTGKDLYTYNTQKDTAKKYVFFNNDTTYTKIDSSKKAADTVRYLLTGDSIFSRRGIRGYSLKMITNDSVLITGDDNSSITIVRVERKSR